MMMRAILFVMVTLGLSSFAQAREKWTTGQAQAWAKSTPWLVGCNFTPSTASNELEMWQADTFDPPTIDRELGWAQGLGFTSVRVFLLISFHNYDGVEKLGHCIDNLRRYGRPILCTEYMARPNGSRFDPNLGFMKEQHVGAFNWGFVAGRTNTIYLEHLEGPGEGGAESLVP